MNESAAKKRHSEDWFGEWRDHWWNYDYLELLARRWQLEQRPRVLDVGSGVGHWGRALAPFLAPDATVVGVEREPDWVAKATETARERGLDHFSYVQGVAEELPFADASFDVVTCQTVLMHLPDVPRALAEVRRVLAPGGVFVAVEPNNRANTIAEPSIELDTPIDERLAYVRLHILCEKGKALLGQGDNCVAERLPGLLVDAGFEAVEVRLCDKAYAFVPPYVGDDQRARMAEQVDIVARELFIADRATCEHYYVTAGGAADGFARDWEVYLAMQRRRLDAMRAGTFASAGGALCYVTWALRGASPRRA